MKSVQKEKLKTKRRICSEVTINVCGIYVLNPEEEKERLRWKGFVEN